MYEFNMEVNLINMHMVIAFGAAISGSARAARRRHLWTRHWLD